MTPALLLLGCLCTCAILPAQDFAAADLATKRLSPSAFTELPQPIRELLIQRGCTIPQPFDAERSRNVIKGSFFKNGQTDWAVLCSRERVSALLVFPAGNTSGVVERSRAADADFLQGAGNGAIGFSRAISVATPALMRSYDKAFGGQQKLPPLTHDGIEDAFIGKASAILYWDRGKWLTLAGAD